MVKGIYVLLTMFLLIGCATVMNPYKMDNRMHKIELGMTKQKVISILGKDFVHNRNVADTKFPYPIKRLEVIRRFNQKSMAFMTSCMEA